MRVHRLAIGVESVGVDARSEHPRPMNTFLSYHNPGSYSQDPADEARRIASRRYIVLRENRSKRDSLRGEKKLRQNQKSLETNSTVNVTAIMAPSLIHVHFVMTGRVAATALTPAGFIVRSVAKHFVSVSCTDFFIYPYGSGQVRYRPSSTVPASN
ncbi:hypothetical protein EVAR_17249_1 [Eumeta japonica]|uniref:Uncharacterized protein n=1 Tax=Eumeta variegata TaxID=151549 RepID=A0A4C1TSY2_EUMVA|nr:hypothetical protein EVAR_17249_1 [Eumeta japonica]